jgi:hypothetical protein
MNKSELLNQLRIDRGANDEGSPPRTRLWIGLVAVALVRSGLLIAIAIGMFGGLLPALRAARLPVTTALRAA